MEIMVGWTCSSDGKKRDSYRIFVGKFDINLQIETKKAMGEKY
jgi:hypothetical protein